MFYRMRYNLVNDFQDRKNNTGTNVGNTMKQKEHITTCGGHVKTF